MNEHKIAAAPGCCRGAAATLLPFYKKVHGPCSVHRACTGQLAMHSIIGTIIGWHRSMPVGSVKSVAEST